MNEKNVSVNDPSGFVLLSDLIPGILQEIRYFSAFNFIGDRLDGYEEPIALFTKEGAAALIGVAREAEELGYVLKIFDAYRPACATRQFAAWSEDCADQRMKPYFYPDLDKEEIFRRGYVGKTSSHSRGSTIDLTLFDMRAGKELDMGSGFDRFGELSYPDSDMVSEEQHENRMLLQRLMVRNGFFFSRCEWWHFVLENEPYPDTYFEFPVSSRYFKK